MQMGMAPPHGLQLSSLRSKRKVSMPACARVSAAQAPLLCCWLVVGGWLVLLVL
jgi:hypothetical protein